MFELNTVEATVVAAQTLAGGQVQAGIFDTMNSLTVSATGLLKNVAVLVVLFFVIKAVARSGMGVAAIVVAAIAGAGVLFLVNGGASLFQEQIDEEISNATAAAVVVDAGTSELALWV